MCERNSSPFTFPIPPPTIRDTTKKDYSEEREKDDLRLFGEIEVHSG